MNFFGDVVGGALNSIPVVGHVKGAIHYMCGDKEAGTAAMHSASRTAAVIGGGMAGAVAGPGGAIAGAIGAGTAVDSLVTGYDSLVNDEYRPHGQLEVWSNVFTGKDVMSNLADAAITTTLDGLGGYGLSGVGKSVARDTGKAAMKSTARETAKQVLKAEVKSVALSGALAINAYREEKKEHRRGMKKRERDYAEQQKQRQDNESKRRKEEEPQSTTSGHGGDSSDQYSDSDSETDLDDVSSTSDSSEDDCSDDESSCQAIKVSGQQCKKRAIENGACCRWKHQCQVKRIKGRLPPHPRFRPFSIDSLNDIKAKNNDAVKRLIEEALQSSNFGDSGYIYLFTLNGIGIKIGCTHRQPLKRINEQYRSLKKSDPLYWQCPSFQLAEYLIHKYLDYVRLRDQDSGRPIELFDVSREVAIRVCKEVIKAIKEIMKRRDDDENEDSE